MSTRALKNYYVVLGVHRGENAKGIRAAYKDLAKQFHPDRIGEQGNKTFQEISEAYQTLSDPEKRRLYNHSLDQQEDARSEVGSETSSRRDWGLASLGWEAVPSTLGFPYAQSRYQLVPDNFSSLRAPKGARAEELNFEVILTAEEARQGGVIPVEIPVFYPCWACGGSGREWMFPCVQCQGLGRTETYRTLNIRFRPRVRSGTIIEASIRELGIKNCYLRLCLVVER